MALPGSRTLRRRHLVWFAAGIAVIYLGGYARLRWGPSPEPGPARRALADATVVREHFTGANRLGYDPAADCYFAAAPVDRALFVGYYPVLWCEHRLFATPVLREETDARRILATEGRALTGGARRVPEDPGQGGAGP